MDDPRTSLPPQVTEALQRGNLIEAIKYLREHKPQMGLAEAKALIEALQKQGGVKVNVKTNVTTNVRHASKPHSPPHATPSASMNPHATPGEVPRGGHGAALLAIIVGIVVVIIAATYFSR